MAGAGPWIFGDPHCNGEEMTNDIQNRYSPETGLHAVKKVYFDATSGVWAIYDNGDRKNVSPDEILAALAPGNGAVEADDEEMIERVENILRSPKTVSYPSSAAAEYVREQLQELLMAYLKLRGTK